MALFFLVTGAGVLLAGVVGAVVLARVRADATVRRVVDRLREASTAPPAAEVRLAALEDCPPPVRRYFERVLPDGQPAVVTVQIRQHGRFRAAAADADAWSDFTAVQHVSTAPPGFVWDASIEMMRWVPVRVMDAYVEGRGRLRARIGDVLTIVDPPRSPALNEGELLRYLGEAPLYPTALLPAMGVRWTPVDDRSARATLTDGDTTVSLVFHFNDRDEVERVSGWRPFLRPDGASESRPWTGRWGDYARHGGLWVPTRGEVAWGPPGRERAYWTGRIERLDYEFAFRSAPSRRLREPRGPDPLRGGAAPRSP